jgi:hypothetical protein
MDVRGYPTGPIDAKGAFTSEIDLPPIIKPGPLNTVAEADRPHLVDQPGMRHKYLPLRHDPATGAISSGGRYLFRGYEDATKYRDYLEAKVFPGEQTTFWKRPFFVNTVRFAWRDWRARSHSDHHTCARLLARRSSRERGHRHILRLTPTHQVPSAGGSRRLRRTSLVARLVMYNFRTPIPPAVQEPQRQTVNCCVKSAKC